MSSYSFAPDKSPEGPRRAEENCPAKSEILSRDQGQLEQKDGSA